ncbi:MAG: transposase, partial [Gammaproteobacteria bacterium]|nr:transposase [Gammaproteobacteria bacterium]
EWRPLSCGNRHCPKCQNHATSQWIDKQQAKMLPVHYFMITFTLPRELRSLVYHNQKLTYTLLFNCVISTLKTFGYNPKHLGAEIGPTMVLHTNSRRLNFHPHIHAVVPGGGVDKRNHQWKTVKSDYLFNHKALAKVFRARFLTGLKEAGFSIPKNIPAKWVVDCTEPGKGISAVKYLARYLYRGVISEGSIVSNTNGLITFKYIDSNTDETNYRNFFCCF